MRLKIAFLAVCCVFVVTSPLLAKVPKIQQLTNETFGLYSDSDHGVTLPFPKFSKSTDVSHPQGTSKVPILVYHSVRPILEDMSTDIKQYTVSPESFEKQLSYLHTSGFSVIGYEVLIEAMEGKRILPANPVVITFDDGWENQYQYAFPLLRHYAMPATFFIFTNAIGHKNYLTWDDVRELANSGMTIGSHTKSHPYLHLMTDETKILSEIVDSKALIEKKIGKRVNVFAYPFGGYTKALAVRIEANGYKAARRFPGGTYVLGDDPFAMKGIYVTEDINQFKRLLSQ